MSGSDHLSAKHRRGGAWLFGMLAFGLVGCTGTQSTVKTEPRSVARRLGFPLCIVSVPMSQSQVLEAARRDGNPDPENYEWKKILTELRPGDQLREVDCFRAHQLGKRVGDPQFYALFRNDAEVARFHSMIWD